MPRFTEGLKPQTAFKRPDGVVELHPEPAIDLNVTLVIHPGNTEDHGTLRFHNAFVYLGLHEFGGAV
jgi:hypothetical protein